MSTILEALRRAQGSSSVTPGNDDGPGAEQPLALGEELGQTPAGDDPGQDPGKGPSRISAVIVVVLGLGLGALVARLAVVDTANEPGETTVASVGPNVVVPSAVGSQAAVAPTPAPAPRVALKPATPSQPRLQPRPAERPARPVFGAPVGGRGDDASVAVPAPPLVAKAEQPPDQAPPSVAEPVEAAVPVKLPVPAALPRPAAAAVQVPAQIPAPVQIAKAKPAVPAPTKPQRELLPKPPDDAPKLWVLFIKWSPDPAGRVVSLRNEGGSIVIAREGDIVRGMLVAAIRPAGVEFEFRKKAFMVTAGR